MIIRASNGTKLYQQDIKLKSGFSDLQAGFCFGSHCDADRLRFGLVDFLGGFSEILGGIFPPERPRINTANGFLSTHK